MKLKTKVGLVLIAGVFFLGSVFVTSHSVRQQQMVLSDIISQKDALANKKATLEAAVARHNDETAFQASGLNMARKVQDDQTAARFFKTLTTWSTKAEYDAIRETIISDYGIARDDLFITNYLPEIPDITNVSGNGTTNAIDAGKLSMSYHTLTSYVIKISGDKYTYMTFVKTSGTDASGSTASGSQMFIYTISSAQIITNIHAYGLV